MKNSFIVYSGTMFDRTKPPILFVSGFIIIFLIIALLQIRNLRFMTHNNVENPAPHKAHKAKPKKD